MDDKDTNKSDNKIKRDLNEYKKDLDKTAKDMLGYGTMINDLISPKVTPVNFDTFNMSNIKSIQNNIFAMRGRDKLTGSDSVGSTLFSIVNAPNTDYQQLSNIISGRSALNLELNYLLNEMSELENTLELLANDIIFPNAPTTSGITIEFKGADENKDDEKYDYLIKLFRPMTNQLDTIKNRKKYNYNIEEDVKSIIRYFGVYGHQIIATIPYKKIAQDLLFDKDNAIGITSGGEAIDLLHKNYKVNKKAYKESLLIDNLKEDLGSNIDDDIRNIISDKPYSESDVEYLVDLLENDPDTYLKDAEPVKTTKTTSHNIVDLLQPIKEDNTITNTVLKDSMEREKAKKAKKFMIDNLVGCTNEVLDPSLTVPVYIKDELVGVYVIDNEFVDTRYNTLGRTMRNIIDATSLRDPNGPVDPQYYKKLKELLFRDISAVLYSNMDKRFLKNNPSLIEDIEYILMNSVNYTNNQTPKIKFIPKEYITMHKIGNGILGTPLLLKARLYAHMYIQLLKSDMMSKIFLEKARNKVKVKFNGDVSNQAVAAQAIDNFRYALPRLNDIGIPDVMNSSSALYQTVIVPMSPNGEEPFEIEQIPRISDDVDNTEYLKQLSNKATMAVYLPADVYDPTNNIDFAKKITQINQMALLKVVSIQNNLSMSLSEFCTKRLQYMTGKNHIEVQVTFEKPSDLDNTANKEILDQKNEISDILFKMVDEDPRFKEDSWKDAAKAYINRELLKNVVDLDLIDEALEAVTTFKHGTHIIDF